MLAAFFGALFGAVAAFLLQVILARQSAEIADIDNHITEIDAIERAALEYWTSNYSADPSAQKVRAAVVMGVMGASHCFAKIACTRLGMRFEDYQKNDDRIYEATTGGSFNTTDQKPDYERLSDIIQACHEQRYLLRKARRSVYGTR